LLAVARGSSRAHAAELAERERATVADTPFDLDDVTRVSRTCSVVLSCFPLAPARPRAPAWSASVSSADAALYAVKSSGRNGWLGLIGARRISMRSVRRRMRHGPTPCHSRAGHTDGAQLNVARRSAHLAALVPARAAAPASAPP
jgi:hypothetical protein